MTTVVSFELAKLLKEKGFDKPTIQFYTTGKKPYLTKAQEYMSDRYVVSNCNNGMGSYPTKAEDVCCSAPTIAEVVMWFYEKHGVWITVKQGFGWEYFIYETNVPYTEIDADGTFNSPTEAYKAAIEYTLNNLI